MITDALFIFEPSKPMLEQWTDAPDAPDVVLAILTVYGDVNILPRNISPNVVVENKLGKILVHSPV